MQYFITLLTKIPHDAYNLEVFLFINVSFNHSYFYNQEDNFVTFIG